MTAFDDMLATLDVKPGELTWQQDGICQQTDPDAFFPEQGGSVEAAKAICEGCPARKACLQWAIVHDEQFGIWGGLTRGERLRLRKSTGIAVKPRHLGPAPRSTNLDAVQTRKRRAAKRAAAAA
jgi:WhiB family redox-sensing transcriptional regulator